MYTSHFCQKMYRTASIETDPNDGYMLCECGRELSIFNDMIFHVNG